MALLAETCLANDDAHRWQYHTAPGAFSDPLEGQGVTELQLSRLWAVTQGGQWEAKSLRRFINVFHTDGGEPLVTRLPAALLADLQNLSPEQLSTASETWATSGAMRPKPADARSIMAGLIASARKAAEARRNVYPGNSV